MLKKLIDNCRMPRGFIGGIIVSLMNVGHAPLIRKGLEQSSLAPGQTVLDIGCGGGCAVDIMARRGTRVFGVDISPVSVRKSRRKNRKHIKAGKASIDLSGVDSLAFPPETFDLVTAFETVYFWANIRDNFRQVHEMLKPGGEFFIALEAYKENGRINNVPSVFLKLDMNVYSAEELMEMLRGAGFSAISHMKEKDGKKLYVSAVKRREEPDRVAA